MSKNAKIGPEATRTVRAPFLAKIPMQTRESADPGPPHQVSEGPLTRGRSADVESAGLLSVPSVFAVATPLAALAVASLATAGIHFAVMDEHFDEYMPFGLFFSVVAWLQALWALAVVVAPTRRVLVAGLLGNAAIVAIWVVSRTAGLPLGPEPGTPEPAAFLDVLSTLLEVGIVIGIATLVVRPRTAQSGRGGSVPVLGLVILLVALTTAAVAAGDHHSHAEAMDESGLPRIDLGGGRHLRVLLDRANDASELRFVFLGKEGTALHVTSLSVTGTADHDEAMDIPMVEVETGQYIPKLHLDELGGWEFKVWGAASKGRGFHASFET